MALNLFLLFHKCGNNYVQDVHRRTEVPFVPSILPSDAGEIPQHDEKEQVTNIRCRNFDFDTLAQNSLLDRPGYRYVVFTRHPASFILSAVKYHRRGNEEWAANEPQPHLGGRSLTRALNQAWTASRRQIHVMTHFKYLYERQASLMSLLGSENVIRVKCEDIFAERDPAYYSELTRFLRLQADETFVEALKSASPAFKKKLPRHSTGEFAHSDPLRRLGRRARAHYEKHWSGFATALEY